MEIPYINSNSKRETYNLNYSIIKYKNLIYECNRQKDPFAVCLIDISNFKNYNYIYGYKFGDDLLNQVFMKIKMNIVRSGYACRYGGDVFLVVLDKVTSRDEIIKIITKIKNALKNIFIIDDLSTKILVNIGISIYPQDSENIENTLKCAEMSLNYSKRMDLYSYCFFNKRMHKSILKSAATNLSLINSVYEDEFTAYYQPEYDAKTMNIVGAEALLRWDTKNQGILGSKDFINIAIENGVINDIGKVLINKVCRQLKAISKEGNSSMTITINMSEKQLTEKNFFDFIQEVLLSSKVHPSRIIIEIPMRMLTRVDEKILRVIKSLRAFGIKIFLDDFGGKYSSISYLTNIPIDGVKIDSALVYTISKDERSKMVFENIMRMAKCIGIEVWVKGIQKNSQLNYFKKVGCKNVQGYLLSKPLDGEELMKILKENKQKSLLI